MTPAGALTLTAPAKPSKGRRPGDYYPTPAGVCRAAVRWLAATGPIPGAVLEPSAGTGAWCRAVREQWGPLVHITAVEPDYDQPVCDEHYRCTLETFVGLREVHVAKQRWPLIIGNPPYSLAQEHVELCLPMLASGGRLAFLLRLAFLEGQSRRKWWPAHRPSDVLVLPRRPSFTGGKTDSAAYALIVWSAEPSDTTQLGWLDWQP